MIILFMGINPKHKGWCTPMSKSTCTGARRRLAITLKKHHGFHKKKEMGGPVEPECKSCGGKVKYANGGQVGLNAKIKASTSNIKTKLKK